MGELIPATVGGCNCEGNESDTWLCPTHGLQPQTNGIDSVMNACMYRDHCRDLQSQVEAKQTWIEEHRPQPCKMTNGNCPDAPCNDCLPYFKAQVEALTEQRDQRKYQFEREEEENDRLRLEVEALQAALTELVRLKDLKDAGFPAITSMDLLNEEDYTMNKPKAWEAARQVLRGNKDG